MQAELDKAEVDKILNDILRGLDDLSEPLESTGTEVIEFLGETNFEQQGAALSAPWAPHSVWTLQARARRYGHYANPPIETQKILIWTGALKAGFTKTVEKTMLTIENNVDYFKYLIGKRKMMDINQSILDIVQKNIIAFVEKIIR